MSVNVGQLFIAHPKLGAIVKSATEYLHTWQDEIFARLSDLERNEQGAEHFLVRHNRRMAILPPAEGWTMLLEEVRFLADGDLARHLSENLGCRVIWAEVQGGALGWACFEFDRGKLVAGRLSPAAGREARLVVAANEAGCAGLAEMESSDMPVYPLDAELAAWEHLRGLGLPAEYIFLYPRDITRLRSRGNTEAGFLRLSGSSRRGHLITALGPARIAPRRPGLPFRPDLLAKRGGVPVAVHEVRLLSGRPSRKAVDSAFAAELSWRLRARAAFAADGLEQQPEIVFRYRDPANPEARLEAEMRARREAAGIRTAAE